MNNTGRRSFIMKTAMASVGLGLASNAYGIYEMTNNGNGKRIGMLGLDTGHCMDFTTILNNPLAGDKYGGYKVVAAYPNGTDNIEEWRKRIPAITDEIKNQGVEIVNSIAQLLEKVDVVLLTCIDGSKHLEQALPVLKAGKRLFIDKPFAGSLTDACAIVEASKRYNTPMFSSSSLRYIDGAKAIVEGKIGKIFGAEAYSPAYIEEHHPDLFWYGVHGVEILFTIMGIGCKSVKRTFTKNTDVVVGIWEGERIGCFRGIREGKGSFGVTIFGEKGIEVLDKYQGSGPLLEKVTEFYSTGVVPVSTDETLEIFAFMQAAEESKIKGGISIDIASVMQKARDNS